MNIYAAVGTKVIQMGVECNGWKINHCKTNEPYLENISYFNSQFLEIQNQLL